MKNKLCKCGCGKLIYDTSTYYKGHYPRNTFEKSMCLCGCGNKVKQKYSKYCSGHNSRSVHYKEQYKKTSNLRFGFDNPSTSEDIKIKKKQTMVLHFGLDHPNKTQEVQKRKKETCIRNFGVDHPSKSEIIKKKKIETNLEHFNVSHSSQRKEFLYQVRNTWKTKSEDELSKIEKKRKDTCIQIYGKENPNVCVEINEKRKRTCIEKYGEDHWSKTLEGKRVHRISAINRVNEQLKNGEVLSPAIGYSERLCLNDLQQYIPYKIIRNDHKFSSIIGRYPDGHIFEVKLFIQFDEKEHFLDKKCTIYTEDDMICTLELASMGYIVFRISEKYWKENKEKVIDNFKNLIRELSNDNKQELQIGIERSLSV